MPKKTKNILFIVFSSILIFTLSACAVSNKKNVESNNETKEETSNKEAKSLEVDVKAIATIEPYHDLILDIDSKSFLDLGFQVGDLVTLSFNDENDIPYEMLAPICDYYNQVNRDDTAIVIDGEKVKIAMHNLEGAGFSDVYDIDNDEIVYHIKLNEKHGYDIDKFLIDNFDFEETTSTNNCKKMLEEYNNIYIVCKGIVSEDLDMNFYVTKDYVMIKTNKYEYFSDGNGEVRYKNGNKVSEVTYTDYNDRFNTDILHFDSEKVINKKVDNGQLIIRTSSDDLKELPKLHILAVDSYMNDGPNENIRIEKNYIFDKNTRRLISYDSFLCKDNKPDLHLQKVSGIFSNVKIPNFCRDLIYAMNRTSTSSNARANAPVFRTTVTDTTIAPYNQEALEKKNNEVKDSVSTASDVID